MGDYIRSLIGQEFQVSVDNSSSINAKKVKKYVQASKFEMSSL